MIRNYNVLSSGITSWLKEWKTSSVGSPPVSATKKNVEKSFAGIVQLLLVVVFLAGFSNASFSQCLGSSNYPNGQWPSTTYTPTNTGAAESITTGGYAGEYSVVALTAGKQYVFSSSVATDRITISTTSTFTAAVAFGNGGPVTYTAPTTANYYFGTNLAACASESISRTRFIQTVLPACIAPTAQPTSLVLSANGSSVSGSFTAASGTPSGYLVVRYLSGATPTNPVDATTYTAGGALGTGTVVQVSSAVTFSATGLTLGSGYDFYVYSYNSTGCSGGPLYRSASPLTGSATPVAGSFTTTANGGLWSNAATWVGGVVPAAGNNITIATGSIVTVDQVVNANNLVINGIVQWNASSNAMTVVGNLTINSGGYFLPYNTGLTGQTINIGGNFQNDGYANLAIASTVINFNGSGSTLSGTGVFQGNGTSGIIRGLSFQNTGANSVSTSQNLIVTGGMLHTAGSLNTNGKLTIDNTAQVYNQSLNFQVANLVVTNMGTTAYSTAPVVFGTAVTQYASGVIASVGTRYVSGNNVYVCTTAGTFNATAPTSTNLQATFATSGPTLLYIGTVGTLGTNLPFNGTLSLATQYFHGNNVYQAITTASITSAANMPVHTSGVVGNLRYIGTVAKATVNFDATTGTVRSLNLTQAGSGFTTAPGITFSAGAVGATGAGAAATAVYIQQVAGAASITFQKSGGAATISGGLTINSDQGTSVATTNEQASSGVGAISTTNGGLNYTVAPTVGFGLPTALNLINNPGSGYTTTPTVTVTGGNLVAGTAITSSSFTIASNGGKVQAVYLSTPGTAVYSTLPTLTLTTSPGVTATLSFPAGCLPAATANIGTNGQITSFTITNPGFGYVAAPTLGFGATSGTANGGTFTTAATTPTARIALYNLTTNNFTPSAGPVAQGDDAAIPANRKINTLSLGSFSAGLNLTGNLVLFGSSPLTLTASTNAPGSVIDLGGNNLLFTWNSYGGQTATFGSTSNAYIKNGSMTLTGRGGASSFNFPFSGTFNWSAGSGTAPAAGGNVTRVTVSSTAAPTNATLGTSFPIGSRGYRVKYANIGTGGDAVLPTTGTNPTVTLNFNSDDALTAYTQDQLLVSDATSLTGPWTFKSASSGTGAITAATTGSRTTATVAPGPIAPTGDNYYAWSISAPTITDVNPTTVCANSGAFTITGTNLLGVGNLQIGGTPVTSFTIVSATQITGFAGNGTDGFVSLTKAGNTVTGTQAITVTSSPSAPSVSPASATVNLGGEVTLTATGGSGTFNWYTTATGGAAIFTGNPYVGNVCSTSTLYVSENNGSCDGVRTAVPVTVNPTVITASTSVFCGTGGDSTLTVTPSDSSITYTWSTNGTATFSATTGESVVASLAASSDITVTATKGSCSTTAVSPLSVYPLPNANVTTTASGVCPGTSATINSGLSSEAFSATCISAPTALATAPGSAVTLINGSGVQVTTGASSTTGIDDNFWSVPIGFSFNYLGTNYTSVFVSTNGIVSFISGTTSYSFPSGFPSTSSPAASIAVCARDMYFTAGSAATLKYWVEGIAPNRKFIVQYANVPTFDTRSNTGTTLGTNSAEAVFYETLGNVDIRVINANNGSVTTAGNSSNKLIGLQNAAQTIGAVAPRCSPATVNYWNAVTTEILAPQAWRFSPPANFNITWSSVGPGNVLTTIQTGVNNFSLAVSPSVTTTYNLSYTNQTTGCTNIAFSDQVTMQIISNVAPDALAVSSAATVCLGSSATVSLTNTSNGAYKNSIGSTDALTYQWQVSTDSGASWTDIAGAIAATASVTPTAVSQYRCNIKSCTQTIPTSSSAVTVGFTNVVDSVTNGIRCGSGSATVSATTSTVGATLKWYAAATGGTALNTGASYTTTVAQVGSTATVYTYYVAAETTGPACSSVRVPVTITVNPAPVFTLNGSTSQSVCAGGSGVTLTSSDANFLYDTFTVTPTTGATLTNDGTTLTLALNPTTTTTYTLLGTQSFGDNCGYSIPITITVNALPVINAVAASPAAICLGTSSTLSANLPIIGYSFAASTGATLDPMTGATTVLTTGNDDTPTATSAPIGFNFSFNGTTYSQYSVSPDGWILLGTGVASSQYTNAVTSTTNVPKLYPYWDDLATGTDGNVKTLVTGAPGTRILKVQWQVTVPRNTVGASDSTFQAWLYEATGKIEYRYGTMGAQTAGSASAGYTVNATNYSSITFSTNGASTTSTNDSNAGTPAVGTMYAYSPIFDGTLTWAPTTGLYTDAAATIAYTGGSSNTVYASPSATTTYYATATNALGCSKSDTGVTVTVNTDPVAEVTGGATSICLAGTTPDNDAQSPATIDFDTTTTGVIWQSSNTAVATIDANGVLTPLSAGTTNVRAYIYNPGTGCTTYSPNTVAVNVYAPIKITLQPNDASALAPATATFTAGASGSGLTYQWQSSLTGTSESFTDLSGETSTTLVVSGVNTTTYYRCKVSGSSPCTSPKYTDAALLTVTCLAISTPASQSVCQNNGANTTGTATLTATITGATPDVVLWQVNDGTGYVFIDSETFGGLTYSGFDTNTLVITGLTAAQSGYAYKLSAAYTDPETSETCETTSGAATVTVNAKAVITSAPTTNAICYTGGTTTFNVSATGATGYQWNYFNGTTWAAVENNVPEGVTYSNASTASLTIVADNTVAPSNYLYQVVLSSPGNCETTTSGTYTFTSNTPTYAATITSANTSFCSPSGAAVALAVAPTGTTAASTYAWSTVPSSSFTATGAAVSVSPGVTTVYQVTGTDGTGCAGSTTITVVSSPSITAALTASANTVCPDTAVTINATAIAGGPQVLPSYCTADSSGGGGSTPVASVVFGSINHTPTNVSPYTQTVPASTATTNIAPGQTIPLTVTSTGATIASVWIDFNRDGVYDASEWTQLWTSASSGTVNITVPAGAVAGSTGMRIRTRGTGNTNGSGDACSSFFSGTSVNYTVNIQTDVTSTSTYSWSSTPADATLAAETGSSITRNPSEATTYTVSITSPGGCSSTASTTVATQSGAAITTQPASSTVCQGVAASFTVAATGPGLTYQWSKNGTAITGNATATTATLTLTGTTPADNGVYSVTVHPICGDDAVSDGVATLLVNPTPTAVAPSAQTLCSGVSTAFALNGTPSGVTFDITGGTTIGLANQTGVTSIPSFTAITGTATLTITPKANGCAGTPVTVVYTVNQTPSAITITPSSSTVCSAATSAVLLTAAGGIVPPSSYCVPTVGSTGLTSDNITNVTYAGINNTTGDGPGDYNYYSAATATVVAGTANTMSITPNSAFGQQFRVWIDMNQNGVFESSESVAATTASTTVTVTASITVPTTAYNGTTRMRVADKYSSAILATEACGHTGFGEFEDYNVTISGATPKPSTVVWSSSAGGLFTDAAMTTPYTGAASGTVYAKPSATATITATSTVVGCSSSASTTVTVAPSSTNTTTVTACGSYTWANNGATYTTSGTYTGTTTNCVTEVLVLTMQCSSVVTVNMNIEGYYDAATHAMRPVLANQGVGTSTTNVDNVTVELHDATSFDTVESTTAMLQTNGTAVATFTSRSGSYYIVVKHRNSLETWSANPVTVGATASYNFTDAASKAYGNNMSMLETGVYGFYSGDINQDGFIEASDYAPLFNDNDAVAEGYLTTDLNGDGFVEAQDYPILFNNSDAVIETARP